MNETIFYLHNITGRAVGGGYEINTSRFDLGKESEKYSYGSKGFDLNQGFKRKGNDFEIFREDKAVILYNSDSVETIKVNGIVLPKSKSIQIYENDVLSLGEANWKVSQKEEFQEVWLKRPYVSIQVYCSNGDSGRLVPYGFASLEAIQNVYGRFFKTTPSAVDLVCFMNRKASYHVFKLVE